MYKCIIILKMKNSILFSLEIFPRMENSITDVETTEMTQSNLFCGLEMTNTGNGKTN